MATRNRLDEATRTAAERAGDVVDRFRASEAASRTVPVSLTLLAAAVATAVLSPVAWLVLRAAEIPLQEAIAELTAPSTVEILVNSVVLVAVVTAGSVALGVPLAVLTAGTDLPFRRFWTIVVALPLVVPSYIGAFAFVSAFGPRGELAGLLAPLGIERVPTIYGLPGAALVLILFVYPYVFLTTRAALLSIDPSLVEAARTLNQSRPAALRRIVLPQIAPGVLAGALLVALYALSDFGTPAIMHYDVFTRAIFDRYGTFDRAGAALLSMELLAVTLVILSVESSLSTGDRDAYASASTRRTVRLRLGRWRWVATLFPAAVGTVCLALPVGILLQWLARGGAGYGAGGFEFELTYAANSVYVSVLAAVAAVLLAVPVALVAARSSARLANLVDRATYVGYAMPGIVLGLSLVYFGVRYVPALYQTLPLLVFAYVVRFIPQAVGTIRSSVLQVDRQLTEAARTLGADRSRRFRRVTLPLLAPGIAAGAALVFLTTMKELPATLMLHPTGFRTIVQYIWIVQEAGYYGQAALPALLLVAASALSMLVILRVEGTDV